MGARLRSRPLIGVTTSELRAPESVEPRSEGEPGQPEMALGLRYLDAVERAGGLPVVLPPLGDDAIEPLLDRLCGLLLSGGPDLDPAGYGARCHGMLGPTEPSLDAFEVALARGADSRGMPILGVCRGAQAINVARGGTLHQHLPDVTDGSICHRQSLPGTRATHEIEVDAGTLVAGALGAGRAGVTSFHHQSVERLGAGLRVVARAGDGVVEAIEGIDSRYVVGVQWHAETMVAEPAQLAIFRGLVHAAAEGELAAAGRR